SQGQRQYGLIAEEVVKVYPELVTKGADGKVESVQYHELIPMLLNEVQHRQQKLDELQAQNAALAARLERLEAGKGAAAAGGCHFGGAPPPPLPRPAPPRPPPSGGGRSTTEHRKNPP